MIKNLLRANHRLDRARSDLRQAEAAGVKVARIQCLGDLVAARLRIVAYWEVQHESVKHR